MTKTSLSLSLSLEPLLEPKWLQQPDMNGKDADVGGFHWGLVLQLRPCGPHSVQRVGCCSFVVASLAVRPHLDRAVVWKDDFSCGYIRLTEDTCRDIRLQGQDPLDL